MRLVILFLMVLALYGCETTKCVMGTSTKEIEDLRPQAVVKVYDVDYDTAYNKVFNLLKKSDSYIYRKTNDMIAIYKDPMDTVSVGIFFKVVDKDKTQIEVSSPASSAKRDIADKISGALETKSQETKSQ